MYKVTTPPATEPISLTELKAQARYPAADTSQDTLLSLKIKAARQWIERHCHIAMIHQTITAKYSGWGGGKLLLECTPYAADLVVSYTDPDGATQVVDSADYQLNEYRWPHCIYIPGTLPTLKTLTELPVTVTYTAGYTDTAADVPADLREAVLILATTMDAYRISDNVALGLIGHLIKSYKNEYAYVW